MDKTPNEERHEKGGSRVPQKEGLVTGGAIGKKKKA